MAVPSQSDIDLLSAARAGDSLAVDELLGRHEKQIFRFGLRMCGSEEDARDVLQETLVAAFQGLPEFRGEADISTWLYQIARSFCSKMRRRRAGEPRHLEPLDSPMAMSAPSTSDAPDQRAHAREIGSVLQAAILSLPEKYREVVVLRDVEGLSSEDTARVTGDDIAAVKSRLHRARMELRAAITTLLGTPALEGEGPPCLQLVDELSTQSQSENDIDQATCVRLERHLSNCERCAGACDALQRTVSLCRKIPGDVVPDAVKRAVRQALINTMGR